MDETVTFHGINRTGTLVSEKVEPMGFEPGYRIRRTRTDGVVLDGELCMSLGAAERERQKIVGDPEFLTVDVLRVERVEKTYVLDPVYVDSVD